MNLINLISTYAPDILPKEGKAILESLKTNDFSIHENVVTFIKKFSNEETLTEKDFINFKDMLKRMNESNDPAAQLAYDAIMGIINFHIEKIYSKSEIEILAHRNAIENRLAQGMPLTFAQAEHLNKFAGLLNVQCFYQGKRPTNQHYHADANFTINERAEYIVKYQIPFSINILTLAKQIPQSGNYAGLPLGEPLHPILRENVKNIPLKRGIKSSKDYFPIKGLKKDNKGGFAESNYIATDGNKLVFIRGSDYKNANGVLASKLATFVSKKHFSSERLLDNEVTVSSKLEGYQVSLNKGDETREKRIKYIKGGRIFPGTGTIDEVMNFVREGDVRNLENYAYSSRDIDNAYLVKIDFDVCDVRAKTKKEEYEKDNLTKYDGNIYHGEEYAEHTYTDVEYRRYVDEKLLARLKFAVIPKELINSWFEKTDLNLNVPAHQEEIDNILERSKIALELLIENEFAKDFFQHNPDAFNIVLKDSLEYILSHFDPDDQAKQIPVLIENLKATQAEIKQKLNIDINPLSEIEVSKYKEMGIKTKKVEREQAHNEWQQAESEVNEKYISAMFALFSKYELTSDIAKNLNKLEAVLLEKRGEKNISNAELNGIKKCINIIESELNRYESLTSTTRAYKYRDRDSAWYLEANKASQKELSGLNIGKKIMDVGLNILKGLVNKVVGYKQVVSGYHSSAAKTPSVATASHSLFFGKTGKATKEVLKVFENEIESRFVKKK